MDRDAAVELIRGLLHAARQGDFARLRVLYADDAVAVSPMFGEIHGNAAIADSWRRLATVLPDFSAEISHVLVDGNRIAVLSSVSATDWNGWFGRPASGGNIAYKLVLLFTVDNNRIVRDERIYDSAAVVASLEKARLDRELRNAAEVQRALLSRTRHVSAFSETVGDSVPSRAICGDFFAFVDLPAGDVGIMLGDVAGKGPAAALLAAMVLGMFETEAPAGGGPAATLARINRRLASRNLESRYATIVYGVLSPGGAFVYTNAGHNPPALVSGSGVRRLEVGGPFVGMFPDISFDQERLQLAAGDTLVLYSDGVTEARNQVEEEYGEHRLIDCVLAGRADPPRALVDEVFASVREFSAGVEQSDDITVAITRFAPVAEYYRSADAAGESRTYNAETAEDAEKV